MFIKAVAGSLTRARYALLHRSALVEAPARAGGPSKRALFGVAIAVESILLVVIGVIGMRDAHAARTAATSAAESSANQATRLISESIASAKTAIVEVAALPGYDAVFRSPQNCALTSGGAGVFQAGENHVVRPDGTVACSSYAPTTALPRVDYRKFSWFSTLTRTNQSIVVDEPVVDPVTNKRSLVIAAPIPGVGGAIVYSFDLAGLGAGLDAELRFGPARPSFVVLDAGRTSLAAHSPSLGSNSVIRTAPFAKRLGTAGTSFAVGGVNRIWAEAAVKGLAWHVYAGISTHDAVGPANRRMVERAAALTLILVLLVVAWLEVQRRILRPMRGLARAVDQVRTGNLSARVATDGQGDLGELGHSFNAMIAERAEAEAKLRRAYETEAKAVQRLKDLDEMKSAFLMAVSHDLRTPLTSVVGYASILEDMASALSPEEVSQFARTIRLSGNKLESLLLDLLDTKRLSSGAMEAHRTSTDLRELVRHVLEHSGVEDRVRLEIAKDSIVSVDPGLMERIVDNLVRNAIKHTPSGTHICVRCLRTDGDTVLLVDDDGPGVPDDRKQAIFELFNQNAPSHLPGTGVGLTLVSQFAKLHGGRAWVEDRPGGGASFRVAIPDEGERSTSERESADESCASADQEAIEHEPPRAEVEPATVEFATGEAATL